MNVAFGLKAHSGWAALVVVGRDDRDFVVVDRRRMELVEEAWAKQPYHAAEGLSPDAARDVVRQGIEAAHQISIREMRVAVNRERERNNDVAACAVLVGNPMPKWSVEEILSAHFRLHKAEGVLFRDALVKAAEASGLKSLAIPEKQLATHAEGALGIGATELARLIAAMGRTIGPPWGKDQKDAALASLVALQMVPG